MMRGLAGDAGEAPQACASSTRPSRDAVRLSHRYITGRQLPDKAVSLLDTACARVAHRPDRHAAGRRGLPPRDRAPRASRSASSSASSATGADARRAARPSCRGAEGRAEAALAELEDALEDEKQAGRARSASCASKLEARTPTASEGRADGSRGRRRADALQAELDAKTPSCAELQGENPLVHVCVDAAGGRRGRLRLDRHPGRQDGRATRSRPC